MAHYDIDDMTEALKEAIKYLERAEDELIGMVEYEEETGDIIAVRKNLENLLEEAENILQDKYYDDQQALEQGFNSSRL